MRFILFLAALLLPLPALADTPAAFMPSRFAPFIPTVSPTTTFDTDGVPMIKPWCAQDQFYYSSTTIAQWGLGAYARGDYTTAEKAARWLMAHQSANGGFPIPFNCAHPNGDRWKVFAPWYSAITQGNSLVLMGLMWRHTGDLAFRDSGTRALQLLRLPLTPNGREGLQGSLNGQVWFEETPDPSYPTHIFNGSLFALVGIHRWHELTGDPVALALWQQGDTSLRANLNAHVVWAPLQVAGYPDPWFQYEIPVSTEVPNYLGRFYMQVHIDLLREMQARTNYYGYEQMADIMQGQLNIYQGN